MTSFTRPLSNLTMVDVLRQRALQEEDRGYRFLRNGEWNDVAERLSFADLESKARRIAVSLQRSGVAREDRVLLLHPPGLGFVSAFFGSLFAGAVPVPAYPPRRQRGTARIRAIAHDTRPTAVLTTRPLVDQRRSLLEQAPELEEAFWSASDEVEAGLEAEWREPRLTRNDLAFLQYTSGSTALPKGVMVTHGNLVDNQDRIQKAFGQGDDSVIVGWLPLYHDMGLIGNVLQPLWVGAQCILMSPLAFLRRPVRWLAAISHFRATTSGGPNFAYDLCADRVRVEEKASLDLTSWQVAFNGAEPVRAATLERFAAAFAPSGFRRRAFVPCYGLAEATLLVSARPRGAGPRCLPVKEDALTQHRVQAATDDGDGEGTRPLVSCGAVVGDHVLRIVDPESHKPCPPGRVGEIWLRGPGVAAGYWRKPKVSEETFGARLPEEGRYLRTGDLGFTDGGELVVTGRLKDLIILRGRNHYPQDFEVSAGELCEELPAASAAAFSVETERGSELVVVQEVGRRYEERAPELAGRLRRALGEVHDVRVQEVVLVRAGGVPRTSSGKVRRAACRSAYLEEGLPVLARSGAALPASSPGTRDVTDAGEQEDAVASTVRSVLGEVPPASVPLVTCGLDSLLAVDLSHRLAAGAGCHIRVEVLLDGATLEDLRRCALSAPQRPGGVPGEPPSLAREGPLSAGQRGLWFLHGMGPGQAVYNVPVALRLAADVDSRRLSQAVAELVRRHPALRTTFHPGAEGPRQRVHLESVAALEVERVAPADLHRRLSDLAWRRFDLVSGPPLRAHLLRVDGQAPVLCLVVHHLVSDLWSFGVMARDLAALYTGGTEAPAPGPGPLAFAGWEQDWMDTDAARRAEAWWRRRLTPPPEELELPVDRPRPEQRSFRAGAVDVRLAPEEGRAFGALTARWETTPFTALLAVFQALLARYCGVRDVAVGVPVAIRPGAAWTHTVGYLVNMLVLRGDLVGDPSLEGLSRRNSRELRGALEHRWFPFPVLVDRLQPERDPSLTPWFRAVLALQGESSSLPSGVARLGSGGRSREVDLGGLVVRALELPERRTPFDLDLGLAADGDGYSGHLVFDRDLFDVTTALRLAHGFKTLLKRAAERPDTPLSALSTLSDGERQQVRVEWNAVAARAPEPPGEPGFGGVVDAFLQQCRRRPGAVALQAGSRSWTYGGLERASAGWARHLRSAGLNPGGVVAVFTERSAEAVIAFLAVLRAGGAYLPLDAEYPAARLRANLAASGAQLMILTGSGTDSGVAGVAPPPDVGISRVEMDGPLPEGAGPLPEGGPGAAPAYVIFTSGSSGRPKGVVNSHRGLANQLAFVRRRHQLGANSRVLQLTPLGFDVSIWEMVAALGSGGRLVVAPPGAHRDPEALDRLLRRHGVTLLTLVPTLLRGWLDLGRRPPSGLRTLAIGGEALAGELARSALSAVGPGTEVYNCYGPSETAVDAACHRLRTAPVAAVPVGRPVDGVTLHLVSSSLRLVPVGAVGEIVIGGRGVGSGYVGRPAETAQRFIPDPHAPSPGARLYRTGDLARRLPGGEVVFLRRADEQVKMRGFRVEPEEVERALEKQPEIDRAVVRVQRQEGADLLVGWVVPRPPATVDGGELHRRLALELPRYMVPGAFVFIDALPTLPSGKVDVAALPAAVRRAGGETVAPRTATETLLVEVMRCTLGIEDLGVEDDFFALGGDSILALEVASAARREGLDLSPADLFRHPTVAALAAFTGAPREGATASAPEPVEVPLTPIQRHFFATVREQRAVWNHAVWLRLRQSRSPGAIAAALARLEHRHTALRLRFHRCDDGWRQRVAEPSSRLTVLDLAALDTTGPAAGGTADRRVKAAVAAAHRSLDLGRGPVWRGLLVRGKPAAGDLLVLIAHHLVVDAVSWRVLVAELAACLEGGWEPPAVPVPSFTAWAAAVAAEVEAGDGGDAGWWCERSRQWARARPLPLDRRGGETVPEASTGSVEMELDGARSEALVVAAEAFGCKVEELLLAALARVLGTAAGGPVLFDVERHGRESVADLPAPVATVGWFTSMFPLLPDAGGDGDDPLADLRGVKALYRSVPRSGLGYGLLRYAPEGRQGGLAPGRPEVSYNFLGRLDGAVPEGASLEPLMALSGAFRGGRCERHHRLEAEASLRGSRLHLSLGFSHLWHRPATVEGWLADWRREAVAMTDRASRARAGGWEPADFPLTDLTREELDHVLEGAPAVEDLYPAVPMQRGMLVEVLRRSAPAAYVCQLVLHLDGAVDAAALEDAWRRAVERHDVLRTAFLWDAPRRPLQQVWRHAELPWTEEEVPRGDLDDWLTADRGRGFDLKRPPLLRVGLLYHGGGRHSLVVTHHHLILDGWSLPLLLGGVTDAYRGEPVPALPPFRSYVAWLAGRDDTAAEGYWRRRLAGFETPEGLGSVEGGGGRGRTLERRWSPRRGASLASTAHRHGLTVSTLVQAAWAILLARLSGEREVLFGAVTADRPAVLAGSAQMVGLMIHTTPLRVAVPTGTALLPWLRDLQRRAAEDREHGHLSLPRIRAAAGWSGDVPLFETLVAVENYPFGDDLERAMGPGVAVELGESVERSGLPLSLACVPGDGLTLRLSTDGELSAPGALETIVDHLETLLDALAGPLPDRSPADLPVLSPAQRHRLVHELGRGGALRDPGRPVHRAVAAAAARTPDVTAVEMDGSFLSYGELWRQVRGLARRLRSVGAGPEEVVGICLPASPEAVVAVLAVLESGAAFLPLDPELPERRRDSLLRDCGAKAVVGGGTGESGVPRLAVEPSTDAAADVDAREDGSGPVSEEPLWDSLAYVLYTSGSSGRPKPVGISHGSLSSYLVWVASTMPGEEHGPLPWSTSLSFDASLKQLLLPLTAGRTLLILPEGIFREPRRLFALSRRWGGIRLNLVPSLWRGLLEVLEGDPSLAAVRVLLLGGEKLDRDLVQATRKVLPGVVLWNCYGPTEATSNAAAGEVAWDLDSEPDLGRPVDGTRLYVAHDDGRLCPPLAAGELLIGGAGLARGYLGRPAKTAERFRPDPFSGCFGERLYYSGDRVRRRPGGGLSFLGRLDRQVKVQGVRVEPGELEAALRRHGAVKAAVALPRQGRLVAFVECPGGADPDELRRFVGERLPTALVPGSVTVLPELPRTAGGKPDVGTLLQLETPRAASRRSPAASTTARLLGEIWQQVLGVAEVGVDDDFFALGGDSVLGLQVSARARRAGISITPRQVFEEPRLGDLARVAETLGVGRAAAGVAAARRSRPRAAASSRRRAATSSH